jgi:hypothetical protein
MSKKVPHTSTGYRKLNSIEEDRLRSFLDFTFERLITVEEKLVARPSLIEGATNLARECGLYAYGIGEPDSLVRKHFQKAATYGTKYLKSRKEPSEDDLVSIGPEESEDNLYIIFCFGKSNEKKRCSSLESWQLFYRTNKIKFRSLGAEPLSEWLMIFKDIVGGFKINYKLIHELSKKYEKRKIAPNSKHVPYVLDFILALEKKDSKRMLKNLNILNDLHKAAAKRGGLRTLPKGMICFSALALYKLALQHDFKLDIEFDYIPKGLV